MNFLDLPSPTTQPQPPLEPVAPETPADMLKPVFRPRPDVTPLLRSEPCKAFIAGSELVDHNGLAKVFYRGESNGEVIDVFDPSKCDGGAIFFTDYPDAARRYTPNGNGVPERYILRAEKVFDLTRDTRANRKWVNEWGAKFGKRWHDDLTCEKVTPWKALANGDMWNLFPEHWADLQKSIQAAGYDAAVLPDMDGGCDITFESTIIFDSRQVKSLDRASGNFTRGDPNVTH